MSIRTAENALVEIIYRNQLRNDLDAYLLELALYGMGKRGRPNPADYGLSELDEAAMWKYTSEISESVDNDD